MNAFLGMLAGVGITTLFAVGIVLVGKLVGEWLADVFS